MSGMHPTDEMINAYVESTVEGSARTDGGEVGAGQDEGLRAVERHLETCAECKRLADDLREIQRLAGSLEPRVPPDRVWSRVERAIQFERGAERDRARVVYRWMATAAAVVLAAWMGVRYVPWFHRQAPATGSQAAAADQAASADASAEAVEAELREAESHYEKAIRGLEQIASADSGSLDPRTAATFQKSLAVIDQAIGESRAALRAQPTSEPARASLMENFKTKLALLEDTVALINEMRKGNDAGTARIVSGLKQQNQ